MSCPKEAILRDFSTVTPFIKLVGGIAHIMNDDQISGREMMNILGYCGILDLLSKKDLISVLLSEVHDQLIDIPAESIQNCLCRLGAPFDPRSPFQFDTTTSKVQ